MVFFESQCQVSPSLIASSSEMSEMLRMAVPSRSRARSATCSRRCCRADRRRMPGAENDKTHGEPRVLMDGDPSGIRTRTTAARGRNSGSADTGE